ncbi:MAG: tyrosine-type recombinase/integrase [Deltaproteobacteria bacterium]|nr:tyrosine-type recombinase/integrase [Deltaproteobacteria bacterium]
MTRRATDGSPRYRVNRKSKAILAVFWKRDRRRWVTIADFDEARLDAHGDPLPGVSPADVDAFLAPLWHAAKARLGQEEARAAAGPMVSAAWSDFIKAAEHTRARTTILEYLAAKNEYLAANPDHPLANFTLHHMDNFQARLRRRDLAPHTINKYINSLRAFLRWAYDRELIQKLPRLKTVTAPRREPKIMSASDLEALIQRLRGLAKAGDPRWRRHYHIHLRILMMGLGCGLRRGEILSLRWNQIDLAEALVKVKITKQFRIKENREKSIPMPGFLQDFCRVELKTAARDEVWYLDDGHGNPLYTGRDPAHSITTAFRKHFFALGFSGRGIKPTHGQRALFATELHRLGADAYTIQQLMGHSNITVTAGYLTDPAPAKRRAVSLLSIEKMGKSMGKKSKL